MFGYMIMRRSLLIVLSLLAILALPASAAAGPFPDGFSPIGLHEDTFYGLDSTDPTVVRWINQKIGASGKMSIGAARPDIYTTASFSSPNDRIVFGSSGMAVGTDAQNPTYLPAGFVRQLYRVTRTGGIEILASTRDWSYETCGDQLIPLNIDDRNVVTVAELTISPSGGGCAEVTSVRIVRYDSTGKRIVVPVSSAVLSWVRWRYTSTNMSASDKYLAIARPATKRRPQGRIAIVDLRSGKTVKQLNGAPRGFSARIDFATAGRLLVWSRIPAKKVQFRHVSIRGGSRFIKRILNYVEVRACGTNTAISDRAELFLVYDSRGKQILRRKSGTYSEPYGMLCSQRYLYYYFGPFDDIVDTGITEGIAGLRTR